jgi:selenophosphate synthetase-related protein
MDIIVTASYTKGFSKVVIDFMADDSCNVSTMGEVSEDQVLALCAAEAGLVSGWECELS